MQLTVKGKHLDVGDALREHVRTNLTQTTEKYFSNPIEANVVFTKEKDNLFRVDISIHVGKDIVLQSRHQAFDPYPAFDGATDRIAKRLRRYKDKLKNHHSEIHLANYTAFKHAESEGIEENTSSDPIVIAEMEMPVQTMTVADAVMYLELRDEPALLFKNSGTGVYNMVFRREDGNIGWVDPRDAQEK